MVKGPAQVVRLTSALESHEYGENELYVLLPTTVKFGISINVVRMQTPQAL